MIPARIPIKGFTILSNARVFVALSAIDGMMVVTNPVERSVVSISQDASAAIPPVPSFFSDIPTPTPIAVKTTRLAGGLLCPYKGLFPACARKAH